MWYTGKMFYFCLFSFIYFLLMDEMVSRLYMLFLMLVLLVTFILMQRKRKNRKPLILLVILHWIPHNILGHPCNNPILLKQNLAIAGQFLLYSSYVFTMFWHTVLISGEIISFNLTCNFFSNSSGKFKLAL